MKLRSLCASLLAVLVLLPLSAQSPGGIPYATHDRILAILPLTGNGSAAQPRRPALMPAEGLAAGVVSFRWISADDGQRAIVEIVLASDGAAIRSQLQGFGAAAKWFERGRSSRSAVETELRKAKSNFRLEDFLPGSSIQQKPQQQGGGN